MSNVSVIIPIYNVEKYLRKCIDSVVTQTLEDIEIILVNDGSTDKCKEIINEYAAKDNRIKTIHKTNGGYGNAINAGFAISSGKYLGIVDGDDFIDKNMYEELFKKASSTNVDIVKSSFKYYSNKQIKKHSLDELNLPKDIFCPQKHRSAFLTPCALWSGIYKKEFINKNK